MDEDLLTDARKISDQSDAALIDEALRSYLLRRRSVEYAAYDTHRLDERDEWGDLATFRDAAALS